MTFKWLSGWQERSSNSNTRNSTRRSNGDSNRRKSTRRSNGDRSRWPFASLRRKHSLMFPCLLKRKASMRFGHGCHTSRRPSSACVYFTHPCVEYVCLAKHETVAKLRMCRPPRTLGHCSCLRVHVCGFVLLPSC